MLALETSPYFLNLDWEKLKAFYYVAKVGNISHAAAFFNTTQSTCSRSITALEKHLGYPLLIRQRNGVTLTRKGEELLKIAEDIFFSMKKFTSYIYAPSQLRHKRKIRIAASPALAAYLINDHILAYHELHPDLIFEVVEIEDVLDIILNDIDLAIWSHGLNTSQTEFLNRRMIQEPFITLEKRLYASNQYLEKYGKPKTVMELKNHHIIMPSASEAFPFDDAKWILGLGIVEKPRVDKQGRDPIFMSNSLECLIEAAQKGKGILCSFDKLTILQKAGLQTILPDLVLDKRQEYFIYSEHLKDDPDIMHIKEYLLRQVVDLI
jgi:DNA-binding transcriptional LysR family regulator